MLEGDPCVGGIKPPGLIARNYTVFSVDPAKSIVSDPSYKPCQKYSTNVYSPGVCPSGHTIAEVTAYTANASTGFRTFWQASCCRR
jgi:hypothetical protein